MIMTMIMPIIIIISISIMSFAILILIFIVIGDTNRKNSSPFAGLQAEIDFDFGRKQTTGNFRRNRDFRFWAFWVATCK